MNNLKMLFYHTMNLFDRLLFYLYIIKGSGGLCTYYRKRGIQIGQECHINTKFITTSEPYLIKIGNRVTLSNNCVLITHDGAHRVFKDVYQNYGRPGPIIIRDNCYIGAFSIILPSVIIGPDSIVGAGAVVTKDVPPRCVVAGVPAKKIKSIEEYESTCKADPAFRNWGLDTSLQSEQTTYFFKSDKSRYNLNSDSKYS